MSAEWWKTDIYPKQSRNRDFFGFRKQLEYKCNDKGILLIVADRFYPSSKLCSCCGNIKKDLKLSDRVYRCECGNIIDRDFQASINLKAYGERFASRHWNVNANMYGYVSPEFTPMESTTFPTSGENLKIGVIASQLSYQRFIEFGYFAVHFSVTRSSTF